MFFIIFTRVEVLLVFRRREKDWFCGEQEVFGREQSRRVKRREKGF